MKVDLLSDFLQQEMRGPVMEMLAAAVNESRRPGAQFVVRELEFNCFDVVLDFERRVAKIVNILSSGNGSEQEVPLQFFLDACGLI
ncbi:hypothetical protein [Pseudomonas xanthosomatis]|uniref:hypothetical protein n=1 Tax=Pseudomonas xanthosomatis TaxID=2842356 RepID=UPI00351552AB